MDSLSELFEKLSISSYDIGTSHMIDVTHINNPDSFYVRPTAYYSYLPILEAFGKQIKPSKIQIQSTVIYYSDLKEKYIRGQILFIEGELDEMTCDIISNDYGFMEKSVPVSNIRKPKNKVDIGMLATHCRLADCRAPGGIWTDRIVDAMKFYVGNEKARMTVRGKNNEQLIVEIRNTCPDDIATLLALTGFTTLGFDQSPSVSRMNAPKPVKRYFPQKKLHVGDKLKVRVQSGNSLGNFYVAEIDDYKTYLDEIGNITFFSQRQPTLTIDGLKENEPITIYNHQTNKYERAVIKKVIEPGNKALVQLVDWGKIIEGNISLMKKISDKLYFPMTAIHCATDENQAWDNRLPNFLHPGFKFFITVKKIGDQNTPHVVNISPS